MPFRRSHWLTLLLGQLVASSLLAAADEPAAELDAGFSRDVRPLLARYCLGCHSTKEKKGELDLERFTSAEVARKDPKPWSTLIDQLDAGEMPPKDKPQPTAAERKQLIVWTRSFLDAEARARAGDPGRVPLHRLSNAEFNHTIRDLTGVDLQPAREFPADGAAGEGFTNAAEALSMSPALLAKFLSASKEISSHAVLLPDGFRFSSTKTRRDWTDESVARLRKFYSSYPPDGRLPLEPYLRATIRYREDLMGGKINVAEVATKERLSEKYLGTLWTTLTDKTASVPLDQIRARWRQSSEQDIAGLLGDVAAWQNAVWRTQLIGSQRYGQLSRQAAMEPAVVESQSIGIDFKPSPGQSDVTLYLVARDLLAPDREGIAIWHQPRFIGGGKPLLLKDYAEYGPRYEVHFPSIFADTPKYLAIAVEAAGNQNASVDDLAKKHVLDAGLLSRWMALLALAPPGEQVGPREPLLTAPATPLKLLEEQVEKDQGKPAINGWHAKGTDLPVLVTNSSDQIENVPGRVVPHGVSVHPTPEQFVAVSWKSPLAGNVRAAARIAHAHPACGNGVGWWMEYRHEGKSAVLSEGGLDLGKEAAPAPLELKVKEGGQLLLVVDAKDANHVCDLTEISFTITSLDQPEKKWDLAADVADSVMAGNPHADQFGNKETWSFVQGRSPAGKKFQAAGDAIPALSVLAKWRSVATNPEKQAEAAKLAEQVKALLCGSRPADEKSPDHALYDRLVSLDGPLLSGLDLSAFRKSPADNSPYGLAKDRFTKGQGGGTDGDQASLALPLNKVVEVKLPAALFREHEFVVDGKLAQGDNSRVLQFQISTAPPSPSTLWDGKSKLVAVKDGPAHKQLLAGLDAFRSTFPLFICFPNVIPTDEVVCLKAFHREDEPLIRLFLNDEQTRELSELWREHRFISRFPVTENEYLPLFIGFVTQDQPKELLDYFESQRGAFRQRAEEFERDEETAIPKQMDQLLEFASRAYRRPLTGEEKSGLLALHDTLRKKGASHEEAFRGTLERILMSPAFLFHVETPPPGKTAQPVSDWELASRLSYFLWSSLPDEELRREAAGGRLHEPEVLAAQTRRMLKDPRTRALAIEFGTQWLHVRGFDELKEKNERLFPTFDEPLRKAIYEESILFFADVFQNDRPVTDIFDSDRTYLNEALAKHYGIPNITGPDFRVVEGVKQHGRGGILGLASVQAKQSGASRTSPVLRGNWVVETLLGEKLPRPPPNVPKLPEEVTGQDGLTMRQLTERHVSDPACASCHQRIDPFGFALEKYDPIGRLREKDFGDLPLDSNVKLRDGTEFEGIGGLRSYLLTKKKDVVIRLFCRRLLGYALGRSVTLSDQPLLDEIMADLDKGDSRVTDVVLKIVSSPQFRLIRGRDFEGSP